MKLHELKKLIDEMENSEWLEGKDIIAQIDELQKPTRRLGQEPDGTIIHLVRSILS